MMKTLSDRSEKYVELWAKIMSWSQKLEAKERLEFLKYFGHPLFEKNENTH